MLHSGTRLGPYEIVAPIGGGGMGDVFKARDTRLDRIVALKISREEFTPRFETEARATAALEHPHICRLYDVCREQDASFLVMEYVEGVPLAGPLPVDRVLLYAQQIASALDEAHRKQIVHRDLKPSNILVTPKGGVKLLDFGLAKVGPNGVTLDDEALTRGITAAGTILGTLHYMSPEQLQGRVADARSDIFAFGLVLYEMVTGKRAFDGSSAASVIAAILERPAPSVVTVAPPALDRVIGRCLAKDPEERWQSARDVRAALDLVVEPSISLKATETSPDRTRSIWPWVAAGVMAIALAALAFAHFRETAPPVTVVRFQIPVPGELRASTPVLSPDGRYLAFVGMTRTGESMLWVRALDSTELRALPGTENAVSNIFWSADSRAIGFVADKKLKVIDVSGRAVRAVTDVGDTIGGGTWNADGVIVFSRFTQGLYRISASGGAATRLTTPEGAIHLGPSFLPDGRHFLYVVVARDRNNVARVATLDGAIVREFPIERGSGVVYAASQLGRGGYFLYTSGATLFAQRVDSAYASVGEPMVVADDLAVATAPGGSPTVFSVSPTGTLTYLAGSTTHPTTLAWFDRDGRPQGIVWDDAVYNDVSLSPDDTRLAVTRTDRGNDDIWIVDLVRRVPSPFTRNSAQDWHPVWSPDGQNLAFSSTRLLGGRTNTVFWKSTGNIGAEQLVMKSTSNQRVDDWSPDGKHLLVNRTEGNDGLWIVPIDLTSPTGEDKAMPYLNSPFIETRGQFYPVDDPKGGSWIVYTSNESQEYDVWVESYPRGAQKDRISNKGGTQPRWRKDGKELFYISPDLKLMAVDVTRGEKLAFGSPRELFQTHISLGGTLGFRMLRYDVTRDGKRFLINSDRDGAEAPAAVITVVLNWLSLLEK